MTNEENENTEIESIADIQPILQALLVRIKAIEGFLASPKAQFGLYNPTAADKWQRIIEEQEAARKQADEAKKQEEQRKRTLVSKCLKNPPVCEVCGELMVPVEPNPVFEVGNWTLRSESPTSWYIRFKCPKVSGLGAHPGLSLIHISEPTRPY